MGPSNLEITTPNKLETNLVISTSIIRSLMKQSELRVQTKKIQPLLKADNLKTGPKNEKYIYF